MIYQLYKKQVEAWKERFCKERICKACLLKDCDYSTTGCPWYQDEVFLNTDGGNISTKEQLLLSRHKDTIELLEAEIERKKGLKKTHREFECNGAYMGRGCYETWCEMDSCYSNEAFNFRGYNSAIDEDIAYLEGELRKLKNEQ